MRLRTTDGVEMIEIQSVASHPDGILIEGRIMGAMPMKAVLTPRELRSGFKLVRPSLVLTVFRMLLGLGGGRPK